MYLIISTTDGSAVEALLLAVSKTTMRLAVPGHSDALELQLSDGQWTDEDGHPVTVGCMIPTSDSDWAALASDVFPKTLTA